MPTIDLNCDMGEGFGAYRMAPDSELLRYVTSANIACGFHAGDPRTMDLTVARAVASRVTIGAHVSYPDLVGFGRRHMRVSADELATDVLYQIGALEAFCRRHGTAVRYVKAHGALYNDLADDEALAAALGEAVVA
jgi:5-oxoprolinase (ATP-hydrolysing) subunit A